jgi:hypothetical protein
VNGKAGGGAAVVEEDRAGDDGSTFEANVNRNGKTTFNDDAGKEAGDALVVLRCRVLQGILRDSGERGEIAAFVSDNVVGAGRHLRDDEAAIKLGLNCGGKDHRCGAVFRAMRVGIVVEGARRLEHDGGEARGSICIRQVDVAGDGGGGWFLFG